MIGLKGGILPPYARWTYPSAFMPAELHERTGFVDFQSWLDGRPYIGEHDTVASRDLVYGVLLPIGMLLRDISRFHFQDPDDTDHSHLPQYLLNTELSFDGEYVVLLRYCSSIAEDVRKRPMYVLSLDIMRDCSQLKKKTDKWFLQGDLSGHP